MDVFWIHRKLFKIFGIYIEGNGGLISKIQVALIVALSMINGFCTIAGMVNLTSNFADRLIALESAFVSGLGATKIVMFYASTQSVSRLIHELGGFKADTDIDKRVVRVVKAYTASMTGVPIFWMVSALLSGEMRTPMPYWFPFEVDNVSKFVPVFTLGSVALFSLCYTNTIVDTAILLMISQLCTKLLVLRLSLENLGKKRHLTQNSDNINRLNHPNLLPMRKSKYQQLLINKTLHKHEKRTSNKINNLTIEEKQNKTEDGIRSLEHITTDQFHEKEIPRFTGIQLILSDSPMELLKQCIKYHNETMELVHCVGKLLHVIFFFQVFLSLFLSCISIFAVTLIEDASKDGMKFIPIFCAQYIQYFIYCWIGEQLTVHCEKVRESAYCSDWYECSPSERKSLFLLLEYTKKSYVFKGCYVFSMSHSTFLKIIQDSLSYFMFLRTFVSKS